MAFVTPTLDEMHAFLVAMLKGLFPDIDVSRSSFPALFAKALAAAVTDNHAHITSVKADLLPSTAEDSALDAWGKVLDLPRKGATPARKANALRLVNNGATQETFNGGRELVHSSGLRYMINEYVTVGAGDTEDVDVLAIDTGAATRLDAGEVLTFVVPPTYVEEAAELQLDLDEDGTDQESDSAYQSRILARFSSPPRGGAQADYVAWALETDGIAAAYAYPNRAGLGTVDVAALHDGTGSARLPNASARAALQRALEQLVPAHATVRVLEVLQTTQAVEVTVLDNGDPSYGWDWNDSTPPTVDSYNAGTLTITCSTALPESLVPGCRLILVKAAGTGDAEILTVESLDGTDGIVLEEAPTVAPVGADLLYAVGELTTPIRDAIEAYIDSLGTANPDTQQYGAWDAALRTTALDRIVSSVPGVMDLTIITPASNVEPEDPAYPDDGTIYVLTPGRVVVRRQW